MKSRTVFASILLAVAAIGFGCKSRPCDPLALMKAFYDSTDTLQLDKSLSFFAADAELTTWAEGVHGRHWNESHHTGADQIRSVLSTRGLRRISDSPDSPMYHETDVKKAATGITFMLRPDRLGPSGKPYDPYEVSVVFEGCRIKRMTVVEHFTQP